MTKTSVLIILTILLWSANGWAEIDMNELQSIPNVFLLEEDVVGGGIPTEADLLKAKSLGIKAVIDLRTKVEGIETEEEMLKKIDLKYFNIPIFSLYVNDNHVESLAKILENSDNRPILIHCTVGGRVWKLWSKYLEKYPKIN